MIRSVKDEWIARLTPRPGLLADNQPDSWTDHLGVVRPTPSRIQKRLKWSRCPLHAALRAFVMHRDNGACVCCGKSEVFEMRVDHIISHRNGGAHHPDNMQTLCWGCNSTKTNLVDKLVSQ